MTAQPDLWSMARSTDPDTSWAAAADALVNADTDRARVLEMHRAHPEGLTDFELAELMGRQQTSVGKRRGELRDKGLIEHAGFKRAAPSGSMSIVWKATSRALVSAVLYDGPADRSNALPVKSTRKGGDEYRVGE